MKDAAAIDWRTLRLLQAAGASLVVLMSGCSLLPTLEVKRKAADLDAANRIAPGHWSAGPRISGTASTGWLRDFHSERLRRLVNQAIAANHDLGVAAARVDQARAQVRITGADLYPQLAADFSGTRSQRASGQRFVGIGVRSNRFESIADMSWELDFWGRIRDERGGAIAEAEAASADLHAAKLSLAANTVKAAVSLAEAEGQIGLAAENARRRRVHLEVLEKQLARGLDPDRSALDVSLSRADLARAESTLASRKREADAARRSLEVLLGGYPAGKEPGLVELPEIGKSIPAGLPSDLLMRRPDIRAAERRLEAALRSESAAKKAWLPSFRMTGNTGYSSEELSSMVEPGALVWTIAGSVAQTIFQGGRIAGNVELARGRYREALEQYAADLLTAFQEVETALAADVFLRQQAAALENALTEAERSVRLALGQYERGLSDVLTLLDAQQRAFDAGSSLLAVKAELLRNRADLHLALGGEF